MTGAELHHASGRLGVASEGNEEKGEGKKGEKEKGKGSFHERIILKIKFLPHRTHRWLHIENIG